MRPPVYLSDGTTVRPEYTSYRGDTVYNEEQRRMIPDNRGSYQANKRKIELRKAAHDDNHQYTTPYTAQELRDLEIERNRFSTIYRNTPLPDRLVPRSGRPLTLEELSQQIRDERKKSDEEVERRRIERDRERVREEIQREREEKDKGIRRHNENLERRRIEREREKIEREERERYIRDVKDNIIKTIHNIPTEVQNITTHFISNTEKFGKDAIGNIQGIFPKGGKKRIPKKTVQKRIPKKTVQKRIPKKTVQKRIPKKTVQKRIPKKTVQKKRIPKKTVQKKRIPKKTVEKRIPKKILQKIENLKKLIK
jgi:hypothetical protein